MLVAIPLLLMLMMTTQRAGADTTTTETSLDVANELEVVLVVGWLRQHIPACAVV